MSQPPAPTPTAPPPPPPPAPEPTAYSSAHRQASNILFPQRSSPRHYTVDLPDDVSRLSRVRIPKRIIVCCDGTWSDGLVSKKRWLCTNILKLSRMMNYQDDRRTPPVPQTVFYQAGVGTGQNFYSEYIDGTTGSSLINKVHEAYGFIAQNYQSGDEIHLFGFSRGAYTARMTAALIGEIGVLDRKDMDKFPQIFFAYQKRGNLTDPKEIAAAEEFLAKFNNPSARGRMRTGADSGAFTVKCLGVFDTVGSIGLPNELRISRKVKRLFGFPDTLLGAHVENAFHAMALHETRTDFSVARFEQTELGRQKGQILKQVWFAGSHADIGGGYREHDLTDIALVWMASNIEQMLSLDLDYLRSIPRGVAPWGTQRTHNPETGIFRLSYTTPRSPPAKTDTVTHEYIHPSVELQPIPLYTVAANVARNPALVCQLAPLEQEMRTLWPKLSTRHREAVHAHVHGHVRSRSEAWASRFVRDTVQADQMLGSDGLTRTGSGFVRHARTMVAFIRRSSVQV